MTFASLLFLAITCMTAAISVDPVQIPIWPADAPVPGENNFPCGPEGIVTRQYTNITDRIIYNVSRPTLWPYLVTNGTGSAVIISPGGGYAYMNFDDEGMRVARRFNLMGVSAFVLKYRVPLRPDGPGMPYASVPLMDAQRAMGVVRLNAKEYGVDPKQIGFMGFSAGGHLTAHISTTWQNRLYPRIDAADDEPCRPDFSLLIYPWKLLDGKNTSQLSPYLIVNSSHPPAFIAQNMDDPAAPPLGSLLYASTLIKTLAPLPSLHMYPHGGHGFGLCSELNTDSTRVFEQCCDWPNSAQRFLQDQKFALDLPTKVEICNSSYIYDTPTQ
jgi:acetyl esterase/lipase